MKRFVEAFALAVVAALGTAAGNEAVKRVKTKRKVKCPRCGGSGEIEE